MQRCGRRGSRRRSTSPTTETKHPSPTFISVSRSNRGMGLGVSSAGVARMVCPDDTVHHPPSFVPILTREFAKRCCMKCLKFVLLMLGAGWLAGSALAQATNPILSHADPFITLNPVTKDGQYVLTATGRDITLWSGPTPATASTRHLHAERGHDADLVADRLED